MSEGLFRQQVTQARKDAWLGGALPRPRMAWPMAILAAAAMLAIVLLLAFGGYTRKERVQGRLVPHAGLIEVAATDHATSARLQVREGPLLLAEFWIPGRAIGTLAVGGDISMRYASLPHQEFGRQPGRIVDIGSVALSADDIRERTGITVAEPSYRVLLAPLHQRITDDAGRTLAPRAGMLLEADLMLEHRRLRDLLWSAPERPSPARTAPREATR